MLSRPLVRSSIRSRGVGVLSGDAVRLGLPQVRGYYEVMLAGTALFLGDFDRMEEPQDGGCWDTDRASARLIK